MPIGDAIEQALMPKAAEVSAARSLSSRITAARCVVSRNVVSRPTRGCCNSGRARRRTSATSARHCRFSICHICSRASTRLTGLPRAGSLMRSARLPPKQPGISASWCMPVADPASGQRRTPDTCAGRYEGRQDPRYQEPHRIHPDQDLGCGAGTVRLDPALPGIADRVVSGQYVSIPWQHLSKLHEVAKYYTKIGGAWSGNQISMDLAQYEELSADEKKWVRTAAAEFGSSVRRLDQQWVQEGIDAIRKDIKEWYVPSDAEMELWRAGAVGAWKNAKAPMIPISRNVPWPSRVSTTSSLRSSRQARCKPEAARRFHLKQFQTTARAANPPPGVPHGYHLRTHFPGSGQSDAMITMVAVDGLSKRFGHLLAVDDISLTVARGEILGFLGPNGSGKSTTMKMITGFLKPSAGSAEICGISVLTHPIDAQRRLGYLPEGAPVWADFTTARLPEIHRRCSPAVRGGGAARNQPCRRADNIAHVLHQPVETLSKGYKRRVGLAQGAAAQSGRTDSRRADRRPRPQPEA